MVYLATSFLYPDLPFLVCSPDYVLGAQASIDELRSCLGFSSTLNLFTTHTSLVGSDVLVHLPYPCQFSSYIAPRDPELPPLAPFSYRSPSEVLELISSVTKTHMPTQTGIHTRIASGSVDADLYYALYCTPYYGFSPDTSADFLVMAYQLSSFLVHCCYTSGGGATSALEDELNSTSLCWPQPTSNGPPFTLGRVSLLALSPETQPPSALFLWPGSTRLMSPLLLRLCLGDSRMSFLPVMNFIPPLSSRALFAFAPPPLYT